VVGFGRSIDRVLAKILARLLGGHADVAFPANGVLRTLDVVLNRNMVGGKYLARFVEVAALSSRERWSSGSYTFDRGGFEHKRPSWNIRSGFLGSLRPAPKGGEEASLSTVPRRTEGV
jgi:hypothetical protein